MSPLQWITWVLALFVTPAKPPRRYGLEIRRSGLHEWLIVHDSVRCWVVPLTEVNGIPGDEWRKN